MNAPPPRKRCVCPPPWFPLTRVLADLTLAPRDAFLYAWSDTARASAAFAIIRLAWGVATLAFWIYTWAAFAETPASQSASQLTTWAVFISSMHFIIAGAGGLATTPYGCGCCAELSPAARAAAATRAAAMSSATTGEGAAARDPVDSDFVLATLSGGGRSLAPLGGYLPHPTTAVASPRGYEPHSGHRLAVASWTDAAIALSGPSIVPLGCIAASRASPVDRATEGDVVRFRGGAPIAVAGGPVASGANTGAAGPVEVRSAEGPHAAASLAAAGGGAVPLTPRRCPRVPPIPPRPLTLLAIALKHIAIIIALVVLVFYWSGQTGTKVQQATGVRLVSSVIKHVQLAPLVLDLVCGRMPITASGVIHPITMLVIYLSATATYAIVNDKGPYAPESRVLDWVTAATAAAIFAGLALIVVGQVLLFWISRVTRRCAQGVRARRAEHAGAALMRV